MQLDYLNYIVDVSKTGSITKSAERLMISQPAISKAIKTVEKEYKTIIFERKNNGMELTKEGKLFITHVKQLLAEIDYLNKIYSDKAKNGRIKLDIVTDTNLNISQAIEKLYNSYKNYSITFNIKETHREEVIQNIVNKEFEVGLFTMNNIEKDIWLGIIDEQDLEFKEIKQSKAYIVVSKNSPLYYKQEILPEELKDVTAIYYIGKVGAVFNIFIPIEISNFLKSNNEICCNDKKTIESIITNTDAYMIIIDPSQVQDTKLKAIPLIIDNIYFSLGWIKRKNNLISKESEEFIKKVYEYYAE